MTTIKIRKCPWCGRIVTGHPNKKFCGKQHKDKYWNKVNPRGMFAYLNNRDNKSVDIEDTMHPLDPYSLGEEE